MPFAITDMDIKPLALTPEFIAQVAAWHHQECERQGLKSSLALRQQRLQLHIQSNAIPQTLVAVHQHEILGCVSLVNYSFRTSVKAAAQQEAEPIWLSNLFVRENRREQGIGAALIDAAVTCTQTLGAQELWLSAAEFTDFYQKRGWEITRRTRLGGRQVNIMRLLINIPWPHKC